MSGGFHALDPCVHCGFCLQACPTYLATGDEADSPRGRIVLMRALEQGELKPDDPALREHLDACLGCRGCEPVCPSGVGYGAGLEAAREILAREAGLPGMARFILGVFRRKAVWRPLLAAVRALRETGLPARLAGRSRVGFGLGMIAATRPAARRPGGPPVPQSGVSTGGPAVALFSGCVMDGLFGQVHGATRRTLEANGYRVVDVKNQVCCGALHAHAGMLEDARALARQNIHGLAGAADFIAVDSAGCGALLKQYGALLGTDEARAFSAGVRDVAELLADAGPRTAGRLPLHVAYDAPCHLQHAQGVHDQVLALLGAIPGMTLTLLPGYDQCCGSAGIYSAVQPAMSRAVLEAKIRVIAEAAPRPDVIATGNPGCLMQIGSGLRAAGIDIPVVHPVELLDRAYGMRRGPD